MFCSQGHNLIGNGSGGNGFAVTDLVGTTAFPLDSQLAPLGDYGGPTPTMPPSPGSLAFNAGDNADTPDTDQRGLPRIVLGFIDIGAVELQPSEFGDPGEGPGIRLAALDNPAATVALVPARNGTTPASPLTPGSGAGPDASGQSRPGALVGFLVPGDSQNGVDRMGSLDFPSAPRQRILERSSLSFEGEEVNGIVVGDSRWESRPGGRLP
jgi:hypothetical protein